MAGSRSSRPTGCTSARRGRSRPSSLDEVADLFHALLAGSLLLLVVGQGAREASPTGRVYSPLGGRDVPRRSRSCWSRSAARLRAHLGAARRHAPAPRADRRRRARAAGSSSASSRRTPSTACRSSASSTTERGPRRASAAPADLTRLVDDARDRLGRDRRPRGAPTRARRSTWCARVRRPDVHLSIVPTYFELFASNATIEDLEGIPVVSLPPMRLSRSVRALKRSVDIVASAARAAACCRPLLAVAAIAIKLDTRGPRVLPPARATAAAARQFRIVKFRTMVDDAEAQRFEMAAAERDGGRRPAVQDPGRPAHHPRRRVPAQVAASTSCRSCGTCCAAR